MEPNSVDLWSQYLNLPPLGDEDLEPQYAAAASHHSEYHGNNPEWSQFSFLLPHISGYNSGALDGPDPDMVAMDSVPGNAYFDQMQVPPMVATGVDSPPPNSGSCGDEFETPDSSTDGASLRATSPIAYTGSGVPNSHQVIRKSLLRTEKKSPAKSSAPYRIGDRQRDREELPVAAPSSYSFEWPAPGNAVFVHSTPAEIRAEMTRLAQLLREAGLGMSRHHPYLTCPLYDCWRGGRNPLLHSSPPTNSTPSTDSSCDLHCDNLADRPVGFFMINEVLRHVRDKHLADIYLRCNYIGCSAQQKLDKRAGGPGKGRFSRPDVLMTHLKENCLHRATVIEELRVTYKLFDEE